MNSPQRFFKLSPGKQSFFKQSPGKQSFLYACVLIAGVLIASVYFQRYKQNSNQSRLISAAKLLITASNELSPAIESLKGPPSPPETESFAELSLSKTVLSHPEPLNKIPKNIITCGTAKLLTPKILSNLEKLEAENPEYAFKYYDDDEMELFMKNNMPFEVYTAYLNLKIGVCKADFFRYCVIYIRGGVYLDLKSNCKKPLAQIIQPQDRMLIGQWTMFDQGADEALQMFDSAGKILFPEKPQRVLCKALVDVSGGEYCQWFVAAEPKHPYLQRVIAHITTLITVKIPKAMKTNPDPWLFKGRLAILNTTGPIAFTTAIGKDLSQATYIGKTGEANFPFIYNQAYADDRERFNDALHSGHVPYYVLDQNVI